MVVGGGGRRGGGRGAGIVSGVMLVVVCLAMLTTLMVGVEGEVMEAHTFAAPFNDVQVDGKRFVSKYVGETHVEGGEGEGRGEEGGEKKEREGATYIASMFPFSNCFTLFPTITYLSLLFSTTTTTGTGPRVARRKSIRTLSGTREGGREGGRGGQEGKFNIVYVARVRVRLHPILANRAVSFYLHDLSIHHSLPPSLPPLLPLLPSQPHPRPAVEEGCPVVSQALGRRFFYGHPQV